MINIHDMINKSAGDYAYNIFEIDGSLPDGAADKIRSIEGIITFRIINA